jgi:hypothetical protein
MEEATVFQTGHQLRWLFICILLNYQSVDPRKLWDDHHLHLSDDYDHLLATKYEIDNPSEDQIKSLVLTLIHELLQKNNSDLDQHQIPPPTHEFESIRNLTERLIHNERNYNAVLLRDQILHDSTLLNTE